MDAARHAWILSRFNLVVFGVSNRVNSQRERDVSSATARTFSANQLPELVTTGVVQ